MKAISALAVMTALALSILGAGIWILDRPRVIVDRETKQLIMAVFPDEKGREVVITDYRDPRYRRILKNGNYDTYVIR